LQTYFSDTLKIRVPSADAPMYELIREAHASVTLGGASISNSEQYLAAMKQEVARRLQESPVFWARLWPAGLALGKLLLMQPALVRGKTVLELGCGLGPGALCAAVAGAREVVATDIEPKALEFVKQSAADNGMSQVCGACVLDWNGRVPATLGGPFDVVLAGDVIYQDEHAPALGRLLASSALVKPDGLVIFSDSLERPYGTSHQSELCERLGASGFEQVEKRDLDVSADCPARTGVAAGRYVRLLIYTKPGPRSRVARTVPIVN
jgi:predicted nicotinamide N-methyase